MRIGLKFRPVQVQSARHTTVALHHTATGLHPASQIRVRETPEPARIQERSSIQFGRANMKRAVLIVAVAALFVAGSAMADGGLIGSGTRSGDSGQVIGSGSATGQTLGSGGFTTSSQDSGQILGSGTRSESGSPMFGSGGFTMTTQDSSPIIGSGTRQQAEGGYRGSGGFAPSPDGGFLGSGNAVRLIRLSDGSSLLVVRAGGETFVVALEE